MTGLYDNAVYAGPVYANAVYGHGTSSNSGSMTPPGSNPSGPVGVPKGVWPFPAGAFPPNTFPPGVFPGVAPVALIFPVPAQPEIPVVPWIPPVVVYCADEDVAKRATGDYTELCTTTLSRSTSGYFVPGQGWTLCDDTANFTAEGVQPRSVVHLFPTPTTESFVRPSGLLLAVQAVLPTALLLRPLGEPSGLGRPPGPVAGVTGVGYEIPTLRAQIADVSLEINQDVQADANYLNRDPRREYDPNSQLARYCVSLVLAQRYEALSRGQAGDWQNKAAAYLKDAQAKRAAMSVKWGFLGAEREPTNPFSVRVRAG